MSNKPAPGRIVHYSLSEADVLRINSRRSDAKAAHAGTKLTGFQVHVGNEVRVGDVVPMLIVKTWEGDLVNGQVFLDGNDTLWVTSAHEGPEPGQYHWPVLTR